MTALPGRDADLAAIHGFLDAATAGGGSLLITGPPGVGKSVLLEEAAGYATAAGARVLRTGGGTAAGTADYTALDELLVPLRADIDRLPDLARDALRTTLGLAGGSAPSRLTMSGATLELLRRAGAARPLLLVVDDAHLLDRASALVLGFAGRRLTGSRVALLAANRVPFGGGVLELAGLPEHRLGRLAEPAARELLRARFPDIAAHVRDRVVAEAGGLPLTLVELAGALGDARRTGRVALPAVLPIGARLTEMARTAVQSLPAATRQVLLLAALEDTGDLVVVAAAARQTDVLPALAPAERQDLVSVDESSRRITFFHPLLRAGIVEQAGDVGRRRAHRALAAALADQPERQIRHLADAVAGTDAQVAELLRQSAEARVQRGDPVGAVAALTRAAELSPDPADRTRRLLEAALIRADVTGDLREAARLLDREPDTGATTAGSLAVTVANAYVALNGEIAVSTALRLLTAGVEAYPAQPGADIPVLVDALHMMVLSCWTAAVPANWALLEQAVARWRPRLPPLLELSVRAFGDPARLTGEQLQQVTAAAEGLRDELNPITVTRVALICVYTDRLAICREALARLLRDGRRGGAVALAIHAAVSACNDFWHSGRWTEMAALAAEGAGWSRQHGYRRYDFLLAGYHGSLLAAARGEPGSGVATVTESATAASAQGAGIAVHFAHHVRALAAIGRGDFGAAYLEASAISPAGTLAPYTPHALWVLLELVEGAVRSGRAAEARAHVAALERAGVARISSRLALVSAGCAAMVAGPAEATAAYERALAVPEAQRWPFDLARIQLCHGEHLRRAGDPLAARMHLTEALEIFQRIGARPWARRAAEELRAGGRTSDLAAGGAAGRGSLTPQQRRIAELAAAGLSNKQIGERLQLSARTVGAHLYRLFPKLGITSRAALRDALRD